MTTRKQVSLTIEMPEVAELSLVIAGTSPLLCHAMSARAMRELLLPRGPLSGADRAARLKHDVLAEYRASMYANPTPDGPTAIVLPAAVFKAAAVTAAGHRPGVVKSQVRAFLWVTGSWVPIYGIPRLSLAPVRNSDIARTPDVRARAILPRWACEITVRYDCTYLNERSVVNLFATAGVSAGVGDWRPERGSGSYGTFRVTSADDPEVIDLVTHEGREAQLAAIQDPVPHDVLTEELYSWFREELDRRGREPASTRTNRRGAKHELEEVLA